MKNSLMSFAALAAIASPVAAQDVQEDAPSPNQIVEQAPALEWKAIEAEDLLVMTLAPDAEGNERKVIIQLMPAPFSEGWTANIRTFARSGWYDGLTVNRVQDNYVVQWGDANYDNPESDGPAKALPKGLEVMTEGDYIVSRSLLPEVDMNQDRLGPAERVQLTLGYDSYAERKGFSNGWPIAGEGFEAEGTSWPVHCYGMVGVGRSYSPDAGSGAELYAVIGHAPRHLDRNIALVGRVVEGIEHLSSLARGKGALGFYEEARRRTPILTARVASDLSADKRPAFEYLSTESETFAAYADARANRRDPFFIVPAGGADICNIPVPIRRVAE